MKNDVIGRDVFARVDVLRRRAGAGECDWCGSMRNWLYQYGCWADGLNTRAQYASQRFCCKGCYDSYFGVGRRNH